jgi:lambda repressor-like predicted transcriptional regulator
MKLHANARTCPNSRKLLVTRIDKEGWSLVAAAEAAGISERSARKWLARWRSEGEAGLADRSSAPRRVPSRLAADRLAAIEALRRLRLPRPTRRCPAGLCRGDQRRERQGDAEGGEGKDKWFARSGRASPPPVRAVRRDAWKSFNPLLSSSCSRLALKRKPDGIVGHGGR